MVGPVFCENQAECPDLAKNPKNRCSKNHDFSTFLAKIWVFLWFSQKIDPTIKFYGKNYANLKKKAIFFANGNAISGQNKTCLRCHGIIGDQLCFDLKSLFR